MDSFIQFVVNQGVPLETIKLMLMFPLVVTIMAATRQVIGIKAFGIYTPSIIAIAFLSTGLKYGIFLFLIILIVGTASRLILKQFRLLYLPRVAIMLSVISVTIFLVLAVSGYFQRTGLAAVSIFPLLIMITIMEKFIVIQIEKGAKTAIFLSLETLFLSIIACLVVSIASFQNLILAHPWLILIVILLNVVLGKWTGLRFSEYYRFKEVINDTELPEKK
ncbi:MAG: 7TM domain-containing protein [Patescibacteria group bacterium]|nr:7TM domain-containing protein [Patescibacteria group bacterium]